MTRPSIDAIDMLLARATFAVDVTSRGATIATEELIAALPSLLAYVRELERERDAVLLRAPVKMSGPFTDEQIAKGAAVLASLRHPPTRPHAWVTCHKHAWAAQDPCPDCAAAIRQRADELA